MQDDHIRCLNQLMRSRVLDVSPRTATQLGIRKQGTAMVEITRWRCLAAPAARAQGWLALSYPAHPIHPVIHSFAPALWG
jgi:hypothetical protein